MNMDSEYNSCYVIPASYDYCIYSISYILRIGPLGWDILRMPRILFHHFPNGARLCVVSRFATAIAILKRESARPIRHRRDTQLRAIGSMFKSTNKLCILCILFIFRIAYMPRTRPLTTIAETTVSNASSETGATVAVTETERSSSPAIRTAVAAAAGRTKCRWTVLVGDSNTRHVFETFLGEALSNSSTAHVSLAKRLGTVQIPTDMKHKKGLYELRWSDQEFVATMTHNDTTSSGGEKESCHILSSKFMREQSGVERLVANMSNPFFYGTTLSDPLNSHQERPASPDLIWFSHGLWYLPNGGGNADGLDCDERFSQVVSALKDWDALPDTTVVWQTNFPIQSHPSIRNQYLEWEVQCQRSTAAKHGIAIFDLFQYVEPQLERVVGDFHVNEVGKRYVMDQMCERASFCGF